MAYTDVRVVGTHARKGIHTQHKAKRSHAMTNDTTMPALKRDAWVQAWASILQKTDRILSGLRVTVNITSNLGDASLPNAAAWTDGLNIHVNREELNRIFRGDDIVTAALRLKGLNYHELSHVLFTPRSNSEVHQTVVTNQQRDPLWFYAYNALEDQRIETWFSSMYGASKRYFEAAVMEWILQNGTAESAILLYGRKYLTPRIRLRVGRAFIARHGQAMYDEFKTIIDSYLVLSLPGEDKKALALIGQFVDLLNKVKATSKLPPLVMNDNGGDGSQGSDAGPSTARLGSVSVSNVRQARNAATEVVEDSLDDDADLESELAEMAKQGKGSSAADEDGDDDVKPGAAGDWDDEEDDADDSGAGDGNDNADGEDEDSDDGGHSHSSSGSSSGDGAGSGQGDDDPESEEDALKDLIDEATEQLDDIQQDDDIQSDIDSVLDAVQAAVQNGEAPNKFRKANPSTTLAPSSAASIASRRVREILARIRAAAEPETLFRQTHGRLDARRFVSRQPGDPDLFRTYDSGREDEVGVEAVLLIDRSASMSHRMIDVSIAMWAVKRAFDKLDITTTVMLYDDEEPIVAYKPGEKAPLQIPIYKSAGGTNPLTALEQAAKIFYKSGAANKVLITFTDGQWEYEDYSGPMKSMTRMGVSSLLLGVDDAVKDNGLHDHTQGHDMASIADLPKAATKLVADLMMRAEQ